MKKKLIIFLLVLVLLIIAALLLLRHRSVEKTDKPLNILTIWDGQEIPGSRDDLNFSESALTIRDERDGFLRGMQDYPGPVQVKEILLSESENTMDISNTLADVYNYDDILMTVGSSTEVATMYSAMISDFFEVPMLIPFSSGDISGNNSIDSSIRMTVSSDQYTDYIRNNIIPKNTKSTISTILFGDDPAQDFSIKGGVMFADDFNGHNKAVKITQTLMDNGIDIDYYLPCGRGELLSNVTADWKADPSRLADLDVIFIIGMSQDPLATLMEVTGMWKERSLEPSFVLIGYAPEYYKPELYESDNIFMLEQDLDLSQCPSDITTNGEALAYAAGYITKLVLNKAAAQQPEESHGWRQWFKNEDQRHQAHQDYLVSFRNNIRTQLLNLNEHIPCYGNFNMTSTSGNNAKVELVRYIGQHQTQKVDNLEIYNRILSRLQQKFGTSAGGY